MREIEIPTSHGQIVLRRRLQHRITTLILATVVVALSTGFAEKAFSAEKMGGPNIVFILADDLGYDMLSCYGGQAVATPHLDKLAQEGMRFNRCYTSPVCTPSRMSVYTSQYACRHGYTGVLPVHRGTKKAVNFQKIPTYAQQLREAGYATSVTGKWQLATLEFHPDHCRTAGFDSWCVWQIWRDGAKTTRYWKPCFNHDGVIRSDIEDRYGPDVLAEYVINQMKTARDQGKPFCIHHNVLLPHWPILETPHEKKSGEKASLEHMVEYMDELVGRITQAVDELGLSENTYIIFMGDNGTDSQKPRKTTAGLVRGGKADMNDAGMHVPLIIRRPGTIPAGHVEESLVDAVDLFPTFCELANVEVEHLPLDGVSFAHLLDGEGEGKREFVSGGYQNDFAVFDGQFRLHRKNNKLIDCRNLPEEKTATPDDPAAQAARKRLRKILEKIDSGR